MGYRHIENMYRDNNIKLFRECYATEKVHGTSAHINYDPTTRTTRYFSGGVKHGLFTQLFDDGFLRDRFESKIDRMSSTGFAQPITIYGEAYGGSCQGMRDTYGDKLQFIAFEVLIGDMWLSVERAHIYVESFNLEFVPYKRIETTDEAINAERDRPSRVAVRRGITEPKISEGVVLRPLVEVTLNNGGRIMCKHKHPLFSERRSKRDSLTDGEKKDLALIRENAISIAEEWVTPMRLTHVVDKFKAMTQVSPAIQDTSTIIRMMFEDVSRESKGEFEMTEDVRKAICTHSAKTFKGYLSER